MTDIHVIGRDGTNQTLEGQPGEPLMYSLCDADFVEATCGGQCSCATCHVYVSEAWLEKLPPQSEEERELLNEIPGSRANSRLCCQIELAESLDGIEVTVADAEPF